MREMSHTDLLTRTGECTRGFRSSPAHTLVLEPFSGSAKTCGRKEQDSLLCVKALTTLICKCAPSKQLEFALVHAFSKCTNVWKWSSPTNRTGGAAWPLKPDRSVWLLAYSIHTPLNPRTHPQLSCLTLGVFLLFCANSRIVFLRRACEYFAYLTWVDVQMVI